MTDDEMRTLLAQRIMGWHECEVKGIRWWLDKNALKATRCDEWQPDIDIERAMLVAEALRLEHGWEYVIMAITPRQAGWTTNKGEFSCRFNWFGRNAEEFRTRQIHYIYKANTDTPERAIFMAAAQVAEAMGGKE